MACPELVEGDEMGWYVYCLAEISPHEDAVLPKEGVENASVTAIREGRLAAIVSPSPLVRYRVRRETTIPHIRVIEEAMQRYTVLPVRFGTVARSTAQIHRRVLLDERHCLLELVEKMRNKFEAGVKVMYQREVFFEELRRENPELACAAERARTQLDRIELGRRVHQALEAKAAREAEGILCRLGPLAEEVRVNPGLGDVMVLNGAFLVDRSQEAQFDAAMRELEEEYRGRATVRYAAPVPPFNFVNLVLHLEEPVEGPNATGGPALSEGEGSIRPMMQPAEGVMAGVPGG